MSSKGELFTEQHIAIHMYMCSVKISENPNRNRKYMFERIVIKILSLTYIYNMYQLIFEKNHTVTENNLKREGNQQSWNNTFEQY